MWKSGLTAGVAGVLLAAASGSALAGSSSSAMTEIHIVLTDLAPDDGIVPALTFVNGGMSWYVSAHAYNVITNAADDHVLQGLDYGNESGSAQATQSGANVRTSLTGNPLLGTGAAVGAASNGAISRSDGWSYFDGNYVLTPNTRLTITAHVVLAGTTSGQYHDIVGAHYYIAVIGAGVTDFVSDFLTAGPEPGDAPGQQHSFFLDKRVSASVTNATTVSLQGSFDGGISVNTITNPVPEPQAWLLMGVGVAAVGMRVRRRSQ